MCRTPCWNDLTCFDSDDLTLSYGYGVTTTNAEPSVARNMGDRDARRRQGFHYNNIQCATKQIKQQYFYSIFGKVSFPRVGSSFQFPIHSQRQIQGIENDTTMILQ